MAQTTGDEPRITHRERVIFPDAGYTKGELADYYAAIGPLMLRFAARRPLSLVRCPEGTAKDCFFQKHGGAGFGRPVRHLAIREKSGEKADYLYVEDSAGLLACVQMGTIEFHGWASRANDIAHPDRMVFDLDPDEGLGFAEVARAAAEIRDLLLEQGLASFALLTGGKGVRVVVPLSPGHSWNAHRSFAKALAEAAAKREPERFTATMSKARRKGRIFIDWLRNARGSTAVMPWSARARPNAPVAAPVTWDELSKMKSAQRFTIGDARELLARSDEAAQAGWGIAEQRLPKV